MVDCHRANVKHLACLPKLGVALVSVSREKGEKNKHLFDPRQTVPLPLHPFSRQMIGAMKGLQIEVKLSKA